MDSFGTKVDMLIYNFGTYERNIFRDILNTPKLGGCSNFSPMVGLKLYSKENHFHRMLFIFSL